MKYFKTSETFFHYDMNDQAEKLIKMPANSTVLFIFSCRSDFLSEEKHLPFL